MKLLQDGLVALLVAIGLPTMLLLIVSALSRLKRERMAHGAALVPARGSAIGLEHTVHTLEQLRCEHGGFGTIVIVDCGLNDVGAQIAGLLQREDRDVAVCRREELSNFLQ